MKRSRSASSDPDSIFIPDCIVKKSCSTDTPCSPLISTTSSRQLLDSHKQKQQINRKEEPLIIPHEAPDDGPSDDSDLELCLAAARKAKVVVDLTGDSDSEVQSRAENFYIYNIRRCSKSKVYKFSGKAKPGTRTHDSDSSNVDIRESRVEEEGVHQVENKVKQERKDVGPSFNLPVWSPLPGHRTKAWGKKATDDSFEFFSLTPNSLAPRPGAVDEEPMSPKSVPEGSPRE